MGRAKSLPAILSRGHVQVGHRTDQKKNPPANAGGFWIKSLAVSYFHVGRPHTIIGAEQFHFRVRKGIGWFPLAMAARQTFYAAAFSCHSLCWAVSVCKKRGGCCVGLTNTRRFGCYMVKPHGQ